MNQKTIKKINDELISYARKKTNGSYNQSQDLVQDVWIEVFNKRYEVREENIPYFKGILMKKFLMKLRNAGRENAVDKCPELGREELNQVTNRIDMEAVLAKLNAHKDGWLAIEFYMNGTSLKDVALKKGIKHNTLKKRLSRLMREFRETFGNKHYSGRI